jgi:hypothetical protein
MKLIEKLQEFNLNGKDIADAALLGVGITGLAASVAISAVRGFNSFPPLDESDLTTIQGGALGVFGVSIFVSELIGDSRYYSRVLPNGPFEVSTVTTILAAGYCMAAYVLGAVAQSVVR